MVTMHSQTAHKNIVQMEFQRINDKYVDAIVFYLIFSTNNRALAIYAIMLYGLAQSKEKCAPVTLFNSFFVVKSSLSCYLLALIIAKMCFF